MKIRKIASLVALIGLSMVLLSIVSRLIDLIPFGSRNTLLIIGFTCMFLGTIWRVVSEMNSSDDDQS